MNADEASKLLENLEPHAVCPTCGMKNPPLLEEPFIDAFDKAHQVHKECPCASPGLYSLVRYETPTVSPVSVVETKDALTSVVDLYEYLKEVLPYTYEPCDQTVQCPMCNAVWWDQPEDMNEDWHAPGCGIQAASVRVGLSTNVRKRDKTEPSQPYAPNEPSPDTRTPAQILRDQVLSGFFQQMAMLQWEASPPEGVSKEAWEKSVRAMIDRLLNFSPPARGPYSK